LKPRAPPPPPGRRRASFVDASRSGGGAPGQPSSRRALGPSARRRPRALEPPGAGPAAGELPGRSRSPIRLTPPPTGSLFRVLCALRGRDPSGV